HRRSGRDRLLLLLRAMPGAIHQGTTPVPVRPGMIDAATIRDRYRQHGFIVNEAFATALQLVLALEKPLLVEGPAGVGKTESAQGACRGLPPPPDSLSVL